MFSIQEAGVDPAYRTKWYNWAKHPNVNPLLFQSPRRSLARVGIYHSSASRDFVTPMVCVCLCVRECS